MKSPDDLAVYFSGAKLYGDDFGQAEIDQWFADEAEAYADLGAHDRKSYEYQYHALNDLLGFRFAARRHYTHVLGLGSAYGDELTPICERTGQITIVDPSNAFSEISAVHGIPCQYVKPTASGDMPFAERSFDLITCFGVLHHIPNVSHVVAECARCLTDDGMMLLREPISSMGDWREPRAGLTKRERGIPLPILRQVVASAGLTIVRETPCIFPGISRIMSRFGISTYNSRTLTRLDTILSRLLLGNDAYFRRGLWAKVAPTSAFLVLAKADGRSAG